MSIPLISRFGDCLVRPPTYFTLDISTLLTHSSGITDFRWKSTGFLDILFTEKRDSRNLTDLFPLTIDTQS